MGTVNVSSPSSTVSFESRCFKSVTVTSSQAPDKVTVSIKTEGHKSLLCLEVFPLLTISSYSLPMISFSLFSNTKKFHFSTKGLSDSEVWDINSKGVRVFRLVDSIAETIKSLLETAIMFLPDATKSVPGFAAKRNLEFLHT